MGRKNSGLIHVGDTMDMYEVKASKALNDWVDSPPKTSKWDPTFEKLYNPGG